MTRLTRSALKRPAAPVGIVHLGVGAFHRSHQAWYTDQVDEAGEWGIAGFTGRSPDAARLLSAQDGLYTLITRSDQSDHAAIIGALTSVTDGADLNRFERELAVQSTRIVTLTVTEGAYRADRAPTSPFVRLLAGLDARRRADAGPIAIVPCDNLPGNGPLVESILRELAGDTAVADWLTESVSFVSTSVDRITPAATAADLETAAALTGWRDKAPVVAEAFSSWVLSGEFVGGRPQWHDAGAEFVDDIEPFERRKLWLLNAAHSSLAYLGLARGHRTIAEAIGDPVCRAAVLAVWAEAERHLPSDLIDVPAYCAQLLSRFENARIEHELEQIARGGLDKLRVRVVPVAVRERAAGRSADGAALTIAAWQRHSGSTLRELSDELADDDDFATTVRERTKA